MKRVDVWRHVDGWAVTYYDEYNRRLPLPTRVFLSRSAAISKAREALVLDIVREMQIFTACTRRVQATYTLEDIVRCNTREITNTW
jgi:hypothetical protein